MALLRNASKVCLIKHTKILGSQMMPQLIIVTKCLQSL